MYYAAVPANGSPAGLGHPDKQAATANIAYVPAPSPFGHAPTAGFAHQGQPGLPPGLAAAPPSAPRFAAAGPQAYAVVSSPAGVHHAGGFGTAISPAAYTSLPYAGLAATIPTSSPAYISTGQYPTAVGYQAAALAPRNAPAPAAPPSHFQAAPLQAGAPLIAAAGYAPMPSGATLPAHHHQATRTLPFGAMAAYPAAYSIPGAGGTAPAPYHHHHTPAAPYVPPF